MFSWFERRSSTVRVVSPRNVVTSILARLLLCRSISAVSAVNATLPGIARIPLSRQQYRRERTLATVAAVTVVRHPFGRDDGGRERGAGGGRSVGTRRQNWCKRGARHGKPYHPTPAAVEGPRSRPARRDVHARSIPARQLDSHALVVLAAHLGAASVAIVSSAYSTLSTLRTVSTMVSVSQVEKVAETRLATGTVKFQRSEPPGPTTSPDGR